MKTIVAWFIVAGLVVATVEAEPRYDDGYTPQRIHAEPLRGSSVGHVEQRLGGPSYTDYRKPDAPPVGYNAADSGRVIVDNSRTIIVNDPVRYADRDRGYYRADGATYQDYRRRSNIVIGTNLGYGYTNHRRSGWYGGYGVGYGWGRPYYAYPRYHGYYPRYPRYSPRYYGGWYSGWNVGYRYRFGHHGRNSVGVSFGY